MTERNPPEALMLLASQCPHCSQVAASLTEILKQGELSSLRLVNLELRPDVAEQFNVRSVPWVKIGDITLHGLSSASELLIAAQADSSNSMVIQLNALLTAGDLKTASDLVSADPRYLSAIMQILENPESKINVRVGAIVEDMAGSTELLEYAQQLVVLTQHSSATVRSDAAHYLSLTGSELAENALRELLDDVNEDVREIAQDGLDEIHGAK